MLAIPAARPSAQAHKPRTTATRGEVQLSRLEYLPAELLALVLVDHSLEKADVLAVGLCSQSLWSSVLQHIENECQTRKAAPWADMEIAFGPCTGILFSPSFYRNGQAHNSVNAARVALGPGAYTDVPQEIDEAALSNFHEPEDPEIAWRKGFKALTTSTRHASKDYLAQMIQELHRSSSRLHPSCSPTTPHRVRNLTTKEYVRCHPGPGAPRTRGYVSHPSALWLHIEDVLLMRTCWGVEGFPLGDAFSELGHGRGVWAWHRFDIVVSPRAEGDDKGEVAYGGGQDEEEEGWKDVTEEVVEEACQLWRKINPPVKRPEQPRTEDRMKRRGGTMKRCVGRIIRATRGVRLGL